MADFMTPAQLNRLWAKKTYAGSLGIFTIVSGWYQWYLPMFFDRIKKELPDAVPLVYVRGKIELPEPWAGMCKQVEEIERYPRGNAEGYTTAALRYVYSDTDIESFDYIHITDADMLLMAEDPDMINQHMRHLGINDLGYYSNYVSAWINNQPKCPGVHFVTKQWWAKTALSRDIYNSSLLKSGSPSWDADEIMLGAIIKESGLNMTSKPMLWAHHGVHLGDWRRRIMMKHCYPPPEAALQLYLRRLLADKEFMEIVELCVPHVEKLKETFDLFREV